MKCVFCGELGPSWCSRYPKTLRAREWENIHKYEELKRVVAEQTLRLRVLKKSLKGLE